MLSKKLLMVMLSMLWVGTFVIAQRCRIIRVTKSSDHSKDFANTGFCYDINRFKGDSLEVQFYTPRVIDKTPGFFDAVSYSNGVLNFYDGYKYPLSKDTVVYNKKTKRKELVHIFQNQTKEINGREPYEKRIYLIEGINTLPEKIQYNGVTLGECPTHTLKFDLYRNDTINKLNENGFKDGIWMEFYDSGELMKKKIYTNGLFQEGYLYDKCGKKAHRIKESALETAIPLE